MRARWLLPFLSSLLASIAAAQPVVQVPASRSAAATQTTPANLPTPIVFVHGNGDDAAKWIGIEWLFASNGYPQSHLHAVRFTHPSARSDNSRPQPNRSSTTDQASELAAAVTRALLETGSSKVVLIGSSRGGNTIRNYLKNAGGAAVTEAAILCGTPNHGVFATDTAKGNEFNGKGAFLQQLNAGSEVVPGVRFLTLRSDRFDKYAQPSGSGYDSPVLAGAENLVLPGLDHREVAFHPQAFAAMYRFLHGKAPARTTVLPEERPTIAGLVTSFANGAPTNLPEAGARLQIFALKPGSAERAETLLDAVLADGRYGPLAVEPQRNLEFVIQKGGQTVTYFKSPILRSTDHLNLRLVTPEVLIGAGPEKITINRPQGYWAKGRDQLLVDGSPSPAVPDGLPIKDAFALPVAGPVKLELRGEVIYARPGADAIADFLWD